MPIKRTAEEGDRLLEDKLRRERLNLQKEISDNVRNQQQIYEEVMKPNSADAKLLQAQVRGGAYTGTPVTPALQAALAGIETPTARFEWSRAEIDRISKLVISKRNRLVKVEEHLAEVRGRLNRMARMDFVNRIVGELRRRIYGPSI
jgi:hypothetical protein